MSRFFIGAGDSDSESESEKSEEESAPKIAPRLLHFLKIETAL